MMTATHYDTLGIPRDATAAAITAAYGQALDALHALVTDGNPPDHARFDAVQAAYAILGKAEARSQYDASLSATKVSASAATSPAAAPQRLEFEFVGNGGEYFRIWIVNLTLSLLTLGIYSAWAKVRREKYFHGNLLLDGTGFDYLAEPKAILKGRAIAFGLLIALSITDKISPTLHAVALLALLPAVPWLVVRTLRFRAHNTRYRGLRFTFVGTYRQALSTFIGYGLLALFTLGAAFPLFLQRQKKFVLDHLRYGSAPLQCDVTAGAFYRIFMKPIGALLAIIVLSAVAAGAGGGLATMLLPLVIMVSVIAFQLLILPYIRVHTANAVWNHTTLGESRFESSLTLGRYFALVAGNLILTVLTLGFFWPWAKVRTARYRASCLSVMAAVSLDNFVAGETAKATAIGDEMAEMFDLDISF